MASIPLSWRLYRSYLVLIFMALLGFVAMTFWYLRPFLIHQIVYDLEARAHFFEPLLPAQVTASDLPAVDKLCKDLGKTTQTRITIVLPDGKVIGDSIENPVNMEDHSKNRQEMKDALSGMKGISERYSQTVKEKELYVAIPILKEGKVALVIRTAVPVTAVDEALYGLQVKIIFGGLGVALLAAGLCWTVSRRISKPLENLKQGAERYARGELSTRLPLPEGRELADLADAMNGMAAQLDDRIRTVVRQRNELEAVLSSMLEGVLAVDLNDRVISLNHSAAQLLGVDRTTSIGRTVQEVVRHADLQRFVSKTLASNVPVEEDLTLSMTGERNLKAYGTVLRDSRDAIIGAVFVLNDVTKLRRLEQVRQDFVANVSHELKTPITSIKGFTETLLEAGLDDQKQVRDYLSIIARQADRLNAIIEDLLLLSRIEQGDKTSISTENYLVQKVFDEAVRVCQIKAQEKLVNVELDCPENLKGRFNPPLLEQAIVNLLDNAIKYSEPAKRVIMHATVKGQELILSVQDYGPGMEKQHLPRVFERFYRVDKARSRKAGGTGLGLAIVKHIALAHGGRAEVFSTPGSGSEFSIILPINGQRSESASLQPVSSDLIPAPK